MKYLLSLLLLHAALLKAQNSEVYYNHMREGSSLITYLHQSETKTVTPGVLEEMTASLKAVELKHSTDNHVQIGNYSLPFEPSPNIFLFKSEDRLSSLYIEEIRHKADLDEKWTSFQKWRGRYSGYESYHSAYYYLKLDPEDNTSLNATFKTGNHIVNVQKRLPISVTDLDSASTAEWRQIDEANTYLLSVIKIVYEHLTGDKDDLYFPSNGRLYHRTFTPSERLAGFINFWTEVKYNFAFFDQVPDLDWDHVLIEFLPRIQADQSNREYYRLMLEICALLNDGHTNVYLPSDLISESYSPDVKLGTFEDGIYVVNTSEKYKGILPIGSKILRVNGANVSDYMHKNLFPYISASTPYVKENMATRDLLKIPTDQKLPIEFITPEGAQGNYEFPFEPDTTSWLIEEPEWRPTEFAMHKGNIAVFTINTFEREEVVEDFLNVKDSIQNATKLIIDLRRNGGGNSGYGYEILKYFSPKPFLTSKWMTREHKAAFKAWGRYVEEPPSSQWDEACLLTCKGNYWYVAPPDTIEPYYDELISVPIVILMGNNTASAAEDFLIAAENIGLTETVGDLSFGSTGQPLHMPLPGGGSARICTKKDTYPDGKEFVGYGIKPKYVVRPGIKDVLENRDKVLEFALKL